MAPALPRWLSRAARWGRPATHVRLPAHVAYVHWDFDPPVSELAWDVTVEVDPGSKVGEYLALYNGPIDGSQCYLGLQTDVFDPTTGTGIGKGLIFSTWWSFDRRDTRPAPDGFVQLGTHEGRFVGIRKPYRWTAGSYRVTLARAEPDEVAGTVLDWYDLYIRPLPDGRPVRAGGIRFPRRRPGRSALIEPGVAFLEVYSNASTWEEVEPWVSTVVCRGDGRPCRSVRTEYTDFPHGQAMPNSRVSVDPGSATVHLAMGRGITRREA